MAKSETIQGMSEDLKEFGNRAGEIAQEKYDRMKKGAADMMEQGRERFEDMEESLEDYVAANPLKSILIAAGVGVIVGRLLLR